MNDLSVTALLDALPAGVLLLAQSDDGAVSVVYCNPAATALLGRSGERLSGERLAAFWPAAASRMDDGAAATMPFELPAPVGATMLRVRRFALSHGLSGVLVQEAERSEDVQAAAGVREARTRAGRPKRAERLLVVEDHPVNRMLATRILEDAGFTVVTADDGVQALDYLAGNAVDLVLMDCHMPRMDGLEATRQLRARENLTGSRAVPVLALTAHGSHSERAACFAAGMNDFMGKPYVAAELIAMVERHLPAVQAAAVSTKPSDDAQAAGTASPPLLDTALLDDLGEALGDDLREIVEHYLFQLDGQLRAIGDAVAREDLQAITMHAHSLKGSSANLGVVGLSSLAADIERDGHRGAVEMARARCDALLACAAATREQLRALGYMAREGRPH